ncbi:hypothetical protein jhhlp_007614 [Lomentospora prolificans]|uniref:Uncharacterized protein n=1 Tax=Lomentospora prolificans TaxID=41688 RepID=A0A2N3N047_9PEZI|nr:hypothetical protein jhhlp_007614 [Lomentospora prolificans]
MAVLVDLHSPPVEGHRVKPVTTGYSSDMQRTAVQHSEIRIIQERPPEPCPKKVAPSGAVSLLGAALSIYPIAVGVASHIDLVTLDSLSRTCRAAHDGLIQYRKALMATTLRCYQDELPIDPRDTFRYRARAGIWHIQREANMRNFNGKAGQCARDMVAECRRCSKVVCRNCAIKQPEPKALKERYRRLCRTCTDAPLAHHINPTLDPKTPTSADVIQQGLCHCETTGVWLCQPCGHSIRGKDQTYRRIWQWRSKYIEVGITDGDRGVTCGREADCLGAIDTEVEMDSAGEIPSPPSSTPSPPPSDRDSPRAEPRSGYNVHQFEGAGGCVTNKTTVKMRVGESVPEWHDEKCASQILRRETEGKVRRWCGWCWRVLPGEDDLKNQ